MTVWTAAVIALVPALAVAVTHACHGPTAYRLVALQLATVLTTITLVLMTWAFDQPAFADLALTLSFLALPGTLAMALFLERWL